MVDLRKIAVNPSVINKFTKENNISFTIIRDDHQFIILKFIKV